MSWVDVSALAIKTLRLLTADCGRISPTRWHNPPRACGVNHRNRFRGSRLEIAHVDDSRVGNE